MPRNFVIEPDRGAGRSVDAGTAGADGDGGAGPAVGDGRTLLQRPSDVRCLRDGSLLVCDFFTHRISLWQKDGSSRLVAGNGPGWKDAADGARALFKGPSSLSIDPVRAALVAALGRARAPLRGGRARARRVLTGRVPAADWAPCAFAVRGTVPCKVGNAFVCDRENNRLRLLNMTDGSVTTVAGSGELGYRDGPAAAAMFRGVAGVAADRLGNAYVSDMYNHCIRKVDLLVFVCLCCPCACVCACVL